MLKRSNTQNQILKRLNELEERTKDLSGVSKKAVEYRNKIQNLYDEVHPLIEEINNKKGEIESLQNKSSEQLSEIEKVKGIFDQHTTDISNLVEKFDKHLEEHPDLSDELSEFAENEELCRDLATKIKSIHETVIYEKEKIEAIYYEIQGYKDKNEYGEEIKVEGLKSKLEHSYDDISKQLENLQQSYDEKMKGINDNFNKSQDEKRTQYDQIKTKIESLLPDALTAGLSSAYSEKNKIEKEEEKEHRKTFVQGIVGLIGVSIIPLAVSIYLLIQGTELLEVITKIPRIILSILPLYIPVLWVAYSANKKNRLSKRLIEEYSHKEALSKTFEGLSKQIENLDDSKLSKELRVRLLYNLLEVSAENPGKLIKDYNKSDHPLMDAIDRSIKLSNSMEKLQKIPGMSKLVGILEKKKERLFEEANKKSEDVL